MKGDALIQLYISVVGNLMSIDDVENMYVISADNKRIYFNADDFRGEIQDALSNEKILSDLAGKDKRIHIVTHTILTNFKILGLIICDKGRFTSTQRVSGKIRRVITVDLEKYELLREIWQSVSI